jgi:hypothetical protein
MILLSLSVTARDEERGKNVCSIGTAIKYPHKYFRKLIKCQLDRVGEVGGIVPV